MLWANTKEKHVVHFVFDLTSRTASLTPLGTTVSAVKRVSMETQPTGPAVSVHAPSYGTSKIIFHYVAQPGSSDFALNQY